jgi:glycosyltransferase involved in cell wall biosynthesis
MSGSSPKVIHIVECVDRGAVENWLVRMLGHARARGADVDWTFYCTLDVPGSLDARAEALGARIVRSPVPVGRPLAFARALRAELKRGSYDVLHAHHDLVSGLYLAASVGLPIRRRMVHVHNADENVLTPSLLKQRIYQPLLRCACLAMADRVVGISNHTLDTFLGGRPRLPGRDMVHYYGVDPAPFEVPSGERTAFRQSLGLADDALILLFGGRITPEKNPVFAVDVLGAMAAREPRIVAVFAGTGSLEAAAKARAAEIGVADRLHLIGWRSDLAEVMCASDWFILPRPEHPMEGFGLAVVEAQLAGLRMLLSRGVPDDPLLPSAAFRRPALSAGPAAWAQAAVEMLAEPAPCRKAALRALCSSPMDMDRALDNLLRLYT